MCVNLGIYIDSPSMSQTGLLKVDETMNKAV